MITGIQSQAHLFYSHSSWIFCCFIFPVGVSGWSPEAIHSVYSYWSAALNKQLMHMFSGCIISVMATDMWSDQFYYFSFLLTSSITWTWELLRTNILHGLKVALGQQCLTHSIQSSMNEWSIHLSRLLCPNTYIPLGIVFPFSTSWFQLPGIGGDTQHHSKWLLLLAPILIVHYFLTFLINYCV